MKAALLAVAVILVAVAVAWGSHSAADDGAWAALEAFKRQHRTDSVAAVVAGSHADSAVAVAERVRQRMRGMPSVAPMVAAVAALQDSLAVARHAALVAAHAPEAGVDSLRGVIGRLVAAQAHGDSVQARAMDAVVTRLGVLQDVIRADSVALRALGTSRDVERARATVAERLVAGWQAEAARAARERRVWQGVAGVAVLVAALRH